eukprot:TRINITY_DN1725_c0_g1_i3.p1 TRINITY_DN1725_c0_g1~~TRINITY_DN1725_c0_g1_i3.p1  ORF type:complete len:315 (+),score=50.04 TRINITY_DN1725_c0_g1_i3:112-1056(+)
MAGEDYVPSNEVEAGNAVAADKAPASGPVGNGDDWGEGEQNKSMASKGDKMSRSMPAFGSYEDLKERTHFSSAITTNGVQKGPTFMNACSNFKSGAKYTFGKKGPSAFIQSSSTPAPGTYSSGNEEKTKYLSPPKFSFGGGSRFGLSTSPTKKQPGPGAYNPKDPTLTAPKVGFGGSGPARGPVHDEMGPGPGAYEMRSSLGKGLMFTARGRQPSSYMRSRSQPGPGAYDPKNNSVYMTSPKCGFGTSTRTDIAGAARSLVMPGPGTYEMQNAKALGKDGPKYSATSRRRVHDLNSYMTPGPGTYNAHTTSFGY